MFKRKCHEIGTAITIRDGLVFTCSCISSGEILQIWKAAFNEGRKLDVNV